jgi:RNA polymerase sigma-70 factor (ECF subfamily)
VTLEQQIVAALDRGAPEDAATEAIRGYGPQILGYLTRVLGSDDEAADAFSYFSERLWKGMAGFERRSSVRVWAYRIAWTAALRVAGDGYRQRAERLRTSMASRLAADVLTRGAAEARARADDGLDRLRARLAPEERALLVLRVDQRLSWRDVGEVLRDEGASLDEAALRKRFERLKAKLARLARDEGLVA